MKKLIRAALLFVVSCTSAFSFSDALTGEVLQRVASAPIDEWYFGAGDKRNRWLATAAGDSTDLQIPPGAVGKRNGGYVWAMATVEQNLWFSVLHNGWCGWMMVTGNFFPGANQNWSCETYRSTFPDKLAGDAAETWSATGMSIRADWRPPQIYWLDTESGELQLATSNNPLFHSITNRSFGFRAAGSHNGVVFMASNPLDSSAGLIYLLAFDGSTGEFIDGVEIPNYINVRRFRVLDHPDGSNALYLLLGSEMHSSRYPNHLLRWRGDREFPFGKRNEAGKHQGPTPGFDIVGDLGDAGAGAEFLQHRGRLVTTTWGGENTAAGMLLSNPIPGSGFSAGEPAVFSKVFDASDFEPDTAIANSWLMGAIHEFRGEIYWGTIFPSGQAFQKLLMDSPGIIFNARNAINKAHRNTHLFRTDFSDPQNPKTELLYGKEKLWTYDNGEWSLQTNGMGLKPLFGDGGFGDYFNDYTWTMVEFDGSLYIGTFDIAGGIKAIRDDSDCKLKCFVLRTLADSSAEKPHTPGFDIYRFDHPDQPPKVVTRDGFGNPANNGIRNGMVVGDSLYLGSSTYSNLDSAEGRAGWELFRLTRPR